MATEVLWKGEVCEWSVYLRASCPHGFKWCNFWKIQSLQQELPGTLLSSVVNVFQSICRLEKSPASLDM